MLGLYPLNIFELNQTDFFIFKYSQTSSNAEHIPNYKINNFMIIVKVNIFS